MHSCEFSLASLGSASSGGGAKPSKPLEVMNGCEFSLASLGSASSGGRSAAAGKSMNPFDLVRPSSRSIVNNNDGDMSIDTYGSRNNSQESTQPPARTIVTIRRLRKNVSFSPSVSMRCVLIDPIDYHKLFYNELEIKAMKADAMNQITAMLRHSSLQDNSDKSQLALQQEVLASLAMPRSTSAATDIYMTQSSVRPDPREMRYQQLVAEIDREVKIDMNVRRKSMRRRHNHYNSVFDELDRQDDAGMFDPRQIAEACSKLSNLALMEAKKTARSEATIAKAILLEDRLKDAMR